MHPHVDENGASDPHPSLIADRYGLLLSSHPVRGLDHTMHHIESEGAEPKAVGIKRT